MVAWHHYILDTSSHPTTINSSCSKNWRPGINKGFLLTATQFFKGNFNKSYMHQHLTSSILNYAHSWHVISLNLPLKYIQSSLIEFLSYSTATWQASCYSTKKRPWLLAGRAAAAHDQFKFIESFNELKSTKMSHVVIRAASSAPFTNRVMIAEFLK